MSGDDTDSPTKPRSTGERLPEAVESEDYARELLRLSAKILTASGHSKERLLRVLGEVMAGLKDAETTSPQPDPRFIVDLPHVLAHWHGHTRYLRRGMPKPLPFQGRGACVAEIIARVFPDRDAKSVMGELLRTGAISRVGRRLYQPKSREILFEQEEASRRAYALISWYGLLRSIDDNLRAPGTHIQRTAINTRFPLTAWREVRQRLESVPEEVLHPFDDLMRSRELPADSAQDASLVGVSFFAFVLPKGVAELQRTQPPRQKRPRGRKT